LGYQVSGWVNFGVAASLLGGVINAWFFLID
jgi:hypothetical protein